MEYPCPFVRKKNLDQLYTLHTKIWINYIHICLMNHLKTHQTNLMVPWDPIDAPLGPLNDDTKNLTETDTETFFPIPNFPKPIPRLFF